MRKISLAILKRFGVYWLGAGSWYIYKEPVLYLYSLFLIMTHKKLKIILTVDPEIPVPPLYYGGIERIVYMLVCGLAERGHQVHLFAHPDSKVPAKVIPYRGRRSQSLWDTLSNILQVQSYVGEIKGADVIHSFGRLAYLLLLMQSPIPKIQSYQRQIAPRSIRLGSWLAGKGITFTACSRYCASTADFAGGSWEIIPNGVMLEKYEFNPSVPADAPLVFLSRIERIKGAHTAIAVAKKAGRRLIIAGNYLLEGEGYKYFCQEVLPHCDNETIKYIGAVDDEQKNKLLGSAAAMLFPVEADEPFGIVMAEALACGTPVIASRRGAVPEVVEDGINGFICNSQEEMIDAVYRIKDIDRKSCRDIAEERFSAEVIVAKYLQLYERLIT